MYTPDLSPKKPSFGMDPATIALTGAGLVSGLLGGGQQAKLQKQQLAEQRRQFDLTYGMNRAGNVLDARRQQTADAARYASQNALNPARMQMIAALMGKFGGGDPGAILQQLQMAPRVRPMADYDKYEQSMPVPNAPKPSFMDLIRARMGGR